MPKPLPESLLALFAGRTRAAAIYGDLIEMAATRGHLWFWTAYVRTVVSLGWRTPAAIVAAIVFTKYLRRDVATLLMLHLSPHLQRGQFGELHSLFIHFCWTVSLNVLFCTWIVFPYVAIRFGLRNRLTCLVGILFLLATPTYAPIPWVFELSGLLITLIAVAALASPLWRRQMIFIVANLPIFQIAYYVCITDPLGLFHPHHHLYPMSFFRMRIDDPVAIAVTVLIGPALYRLLLQPRHTEAAYV